MAAPASVPSSARSDASTSDSRSPTVAKSDTCVSAPTNTTPSTGRFRTTSSGSDAHPAGELGLPPFPAHHRHRELHEVRGAPGVTAGQRVADRLRRVAVGLEPAAGPPVQLGAPRPACSSSRCACSTSANRWW